MAKRKRDWMERRYHFNMWMSAEERQMLEKAARQAGLSLSDWVRQRVREHAEPTRQQRAA